MGNTVQYSCHEGYVLIGEPIIRCTETGLWSHAPPFCKFMHVADIYFLPRVISGILDHFPLVKIISIEPDLLGDWVGAVRIAWFWVIYVDFVQLCCKDKQAEELRILL